LANNSAVFRKNRFATGRAIAKINNFAADSCFCPRIKSVNAAIIHFPSWSVYFIGSGKKAEFQERKTTEPVEVVVFVDGRKKPDTGSGDITAILSRRSLKLIIVKFSTEFEIIQVPFVDS
jgi:hypothetical protein